MENRDNLRTSDQWEKIKPTIKVIDPDGWDRKNFNYSWFEELITEKEYDQRVLRSTIVIKRPLVFEPKVTI